MAWSTLPFLVALLAACLHGGFCVTPQELEAWFSSADGLAMTKEDASSLAQKEYTALTQCGVTVQSLSKLKAVLYDHTGFDLPMADLRKAVLRLAKQHISPDKLASMFKALTSSYTVSGGLAVPKEIAQTVSQMLLEARGEPDQLYALYKVMYGYKGLGFAYELARDTATQGVEFGADADQFKESYLKTKNVDEAMKAAVNANLQGLVRRYAKDAKPYTAPEFQQHYPNDWTKQWTEAPMELRISEDRIEHTASQFSRHYGSKWAAKYRVAEEATQIRLADNGQAYTMPEFQQYYLDDWPAWWSVAAELPCRQCAQFPGTAASAKEAELVV